MRLLFSRLFVWGVRWCELRKVEADGRILLFGRVRCGQFPYQMIVVELLPLEFEVGLNDSLYCSEIWLAVEVIRSQILCNLFRSLPLFHLLEET